MPEIMACEWSEDEDGTWDTSCGNAFVIVDGTPVENEFHFCAYCGKQLKEVRYADEN